jgi:uncharacterized protein
LHAQGQPDRIPALDLIRGIAVLGILAVNIAGFAAPDSASVSPHLPRTGTPADVWTFAAVMIVFEGKMRGLFALLFGASMLLFVERAEAKGRDGARLQLHRLGWLALFGYLHFLLLWDGDILFLYAVVGLGALGLRRAAPLPSVLAALVMFALWQGVGTAMWYPAVSNEAAVLDGAASAAQHQSHGAALAAARQEDQLDIERATLGFADQARTRLTDEAFFPLLLVIFNWAEVLTLMLVGMALYRTGFFTGAWPRAQLRQIALLGIVGGGAMTAGFVLWAGQRGFPEMLMHQAIQSMLGSAHLFMTLGFAALAMLRAEWLLGRALGRRLEAAGRMAFSNYLATSLVMTAIFSGWGLGLFGQYGSFGQMAFVVLGWALMLGWSKPWLDRYRQGPLEWLWRSLTQRRWLPMRRD